MTEKDNSIYLLTGYEGIASLLSPRHWLLTEAREQQTCYSRIHSL